MAQQSVYERIEDYVRSTLGISPPSGAIAKTISSIKPTAKVEPGDRLESAAAEVCAIACREGGLILSQQAVAKRLRSVAEESERKLAVVTAALSAVGRSDAVGVKMHDILVILSDEILTEPYWGTNKIVRERPIAEHQVCDECDPRTIQFSKRAADTGACKDQIEKIHRWVLHRLNVLGLEARVEAAIWSRRGTCAGKDHDERGHGWFELSVILVRVDLGAGAVIEKEYEITWPKT